MELGSSLPATTRIIFKSLHESRAEVDFFFLDFIYKEELMFIVTRTVYI